MKRKLYINKEWQEPCAWYLPPSTDKIQWVKRNKIPKWYLDLLNGKKVKIKINLKDWKFFTGSTK